MKFITVITLFFCISFQVSAISTQEATDSIITNYYSLLESAKKRPDYRQIWNNYNRIADLYHLNGKVKQTLNILQESITYFTDQIRNKPVDSLLLALLATNYNLLAYRQNNYGHWVNTIESCQMGLEMAEKAENDSLAASLLVNTGKIYAKIGARETFQKFFTIADEKARKSNNYEAILEIYNVTGKNRKGLKYAKEVGNLKYTGTFYYKLANGNIDKNLPLARHYLDSAFTILPNEAYLERFQAFIANAHYYSVINNPSKQFEYLLKGKELAGLLNDREVDKHLFGMLGDYYLEQGDSIKAYKNIKTRDSLQMALTSSAQICRINKLESQAELNQKVKEILWLKNMNKTTFLVIVLFFSIALFLGYSIFKIRRVKKRLNESNRIKTKLFSIISHEMRSPLITLRNLFYLQEEKGGVEENLDMELTRIFEMLDNLLNWSASQMQEIKEYPVIIDLNELLENMIRFIQAQINFKKIKLKIEIPDDLVAYADENMIDISIRNIFTNAVKYTPIGGKILIKAYEENKQVIILIQDNGPGLESTADNKEKGLGIGLEISRDFISRNNGRINIKSGRDGTKAEIILPVEQV